MEAVEKLNREEGSVGAGDSPPPDVAARRRAAVELVRNHRIVLMASARRVSLCSDDAEDAFQRGLEILLSKAPTADTKRLLPWARTVIRNEALSIRRTRERTMGRPRGTGDDAGRDDEARDWVGSLPSDRRALEEVVEGREEVARSREALALLKPQELKALSQLASGMSYAEIASANGWTRTKVNRCLAEGREKLRSVVRQTETGARCRSIEPLISAAADGELDAEVEGEVRNHLAVCGGCRATLREYRRIPAAAVAAGALSTIAELDPGRPGIFARVADRIDELSLQAWLRLNGLFGGDPAATSTLGSGGIREAGTTAVAKVAAICIGTAGGAAACLGTGLVTLPGEREPRPEPAPIRIEAVAGPAEAADESPPPSSSAAPPADRPSSPSIPGPSGGNPDSGNEGGGEAPVPAPSPEPDPVAAEFSPGSAAPAPAPAPVQASPPPPSPAPVQQSAKPTGQVPLGGSGEFGP